MKKKHVLNINTKMVPPEKTVMFSLGFFFRLFIVNFQRFSFYFNEFFVKYRRNNIYAIIFVIQKNDLNKMLVISHKLNNK